MYACRTCNDTYCAGCYEAEEPETERARCRCGRFFSRPVGLLVTPKTCRDCTDRYQALVSRSPLLQHVEGARNTHIALGSLAPVRRTA